MRKTLSPSRPSERTPARSPRFIILVIVAGLIVIGGAAAIVSIATGSQDMHARAVTHFGGPFQLVDQNGKAVTESALRGRRVVMFFGYTHCPDICPTALSDLSQLQTALGKQAAEIQFVFVTVDPQRDTPDVLRQYLAQFLGKFLGLSGPPAQVDAMLREYGVTHQRVDEKGGIYSMDHTASMFLINANGSLAGTIAPQDDLAVILAKVRRLLGSQRV